MTDVWNLGTVYLSFALASPVSEEHFVQSARAEREGRYDVAVSACRQVLELDPGGARSQACTQRVASLEARRDPAGDFEGYRALNLVRRTHRERGADAGVADLLPLLDDAGVAVTVRAEVAVWLARDALGRSKDASLAQDYCERALSYEPMDPTVRRQLVSLQSRALAALGEHDRALAVEQEVRIGTTRLSPVDLVIRERRRNQISMAAYGVVAAFGLVGAMPSVRGWRRPEPPKPKGLWVIALGTAFAAALCEGWSAGAGTPVLVAGCLFGMVHLFALGGLLALADSPWLVPFRIGTALGTGACLWLAVTWTDAHDWLGW